MNICPEWMENIAVIGIRGGNRLGGPCPWRSCMSSLDCSVATGHRAARARLSVALLAVSAFVIVTTEFLIVGLLPALARDLGLGIARAGQLVTLFAFTVMLAGPPLTALLAHLDRRRLFVAILLLFAASNALAAVATLPWLLALARVLPALALPVFWGTASETAAQLAPAGQGACGGTGLSGHHRRDAVRHPAGYAGRRGHRLARQLLAAVGAVAADGGRTRTVDAGHRSRVTARAGRTGARAAAAVVAGQRAAVGAGVHRHVHRLHLSGRRARAPVAGSRRAGGLVADGLRCGRVAWQCTGRALGGSCTAGRDAGVLHGAGAGRAGQRLAGRAGRGRSSHWRCGVLRIPRCSRCARCG